MGYLLGNVWSGGAPDALRDAVALLSAGEVSANLATNTLSSVNPVQPVSDSAEWIDHYRCKDPGYSGDDPIFGTEEPFAFGSGCWAGTHKKYITAGGGGHTNGACSESYAFDAPTLTWSMRDLGATLADGSYEDPTAWFQSSDSSGWRAWPNANGRHCPAPCHLYGSLDYDPDNDLVCVFGGGVYPSGQGGPGGMVTVDGATGHWNQIYHVAATNDSLEGTSYWLDCDDGAGGTEKRVIFASNAGAGKVARIDPLGGAATENALSLFANNRPPATVGAIIPDPGNAGRKAYAYYYDDTHFALVPNVDLLGNTEANAVLKTYGNTKPAGITQNATWMHLSGWGVIAVYQQGDGLYTLSLDDYTWSAQLVAAPDSGSGNIRKRIFPMPEYGAFGLFSDDGSEFRAIKYPAEIA